MEGKTKKSGKWSCHTVSFGHPSHPQKQTETVPSVTYLSKKCYIFREIPERLDQVGRRRSVGLTTKSCNHHRRYVCEPFHCNNNCSLSHGPLSGRTPSDHEWWINGPVSWNNRQKKRFVSQRSPPTLFANFWRTKAARPESRNGLQPGTKSTPLPPHPLHPPRTTSSLSHPDLPTFTVAIVAYR